jgi:hypothetical protein
MLSQCHLFVIFFILFINHVSLSNIHKLNDIDISKYMVVLNYHSSKYDLFLFINVYKNQNAIKDCIQNCH